MERFFIVILSLVSVLSVCVSQASANPMSSANYRITTTVMSSGGGPMGSTNIQINSTLGQPSPLIDPDNPTGSARYDLLTGFWYIVDIGSPLSGCPADFNYDGSVDIDDLDILAGNFGQTGIGNNSDEDLDMDGLDLHWMIVDYNRDDCMD